MSTKYIHPMRDFSRGIIDSEASNLIPDNALVEAQNAVLGKGFVEKRNGYQTYAYTPTGTRLTKWSDLGSKKWGEL